MRAVLLVTCALSLLSCDDLIFGPLLKDNPDHCVLNPSICHTDEVCDPVLARCVVPSAGTPLPSEVEPALGPTTGGTPLTIRGTGFVAGCRVQIGSLWAADPVVKSGTEIGAMLPEQPGRLGKVPVTVECPGDRRGTRADLFSYYAGTIRLTPIETLSVGDQPGSVAVADLDGDGQKDLAVANKGAGTVSLLFGGGGGGFQSGTLMVGTGPNSVSAGDVNGDGKPDLLVTSFEQQSPSLYLNNGARSFQVPKAVPDAYNAVGGLLVDVDLDKHLDVLILESIGANGYVSIARGRGDGTFMQPLSENAGVVPRFMISADYNRDTFPDLLVGAEAQGDLLLLPGLGT
jgi:hypothetical protein